jgi:hypothetical protein
MLSIMNEATAGAATGQGRKPIVVAAPAAVSPELTDRPRRRIFTAEDKLRILASSRPIADLQSAR